MPCIPAVNQSRKYHKLIVISGLGLALSIGSAAAFAQQDQPGQVNATIDQQNSQAQARPDQSVPAQAQPNQGLPPQTLTLPAGTVIRVRTNDWLSTDRNLPGDEFSAVLDQPIVVDGWVIARRGQEETGRVSMSQKAGRGNHNASQLGVQLSELTIVDGQHLPLETQLVRTSAGSSRGRDAAIIGTTTGVGAAIGAVADGGVGAAVGAIAGGAAGIIGVFSTPGKPTVIPSESVLSFRLTNALTISTEKSQIAFQPVEQADYDSRESNNRPQRIASPRGPGYAPPPPYYGYPYAYGYPHPYGYYYPSPLVFGFGFGGGYGYGPRFGGYRGGFRGGRR